MEKRDKSISRVWLVALAVGLIPYHVKQDKETGAFDVVSLIWSLKKTPNEKGDAYAFELLPLLGGKRFTFFRWSFTKEQEQKNGNSYEGETKDEE